MALIFAPNIADIGPRYRVLRPSLRVRATGECLLLAHRRHHL